MIIDKVTEINVPIVTIVVILVTKFGSMHVFFMQGSSHERRIICADRYFLNKSGVSG